jgi:signal transduction histidine kinase
MPHSSNGFLVSSPLPTTPDDGTPAQQVCDLPLAARDHIHARNEEIAIICHELRNSLAVVRSAVRLLRSPAASDAATARTLIERNVGHMSRHIEDLLAPFRRAGGIHGLQLAHVDLRVIAQHSLDAIAPEMARRGHRLVARLPQEPIWANADGARLEQVFANLLSNAAKYTPNGGDIAFSLERDADQVYVRVSDSGMGIEASMLSRVFCLFVQVGSTLPWAEGGHGIGLAVVRNLVELHGGSVKATSAGPGSGSEFTVVLPALWSQG